MRVTCTAAPSKPATHDSQVAGSDLGRNGGALPLEPTEAVPQAHVMRFRRSERRLHWSIAVPFMACFATALILVLVYNSAPNRAWRDIFSWAHRISGLCLLVFPTLAAMGSKRDFRIHLDNIKQAWCWTLSDVKWIALMGAAALSRRVTLPESGKFNAAEKMNFMLVMATWPLFIVTGVLIWLPGPDFLAWIAHIALAVMMAPLMLGHIYMATINPSTRIGLPGMISGFVDRDWARHHYARWYRETFEKAANLAGLRAAVTPEPRITVFCSSCGPSDSTLSWPEFVQSRLHKNRLRCPACKVEKQIVLVIAEHNSERFIQHFMDHRPDASPFAGGLPRDLVVLALVAHRAQRSTLVPSPRASSQPGPSAPPSVRPATPQYVGVGARDEPVLGPGGHHERPRGEARADSQRRPEYCGDDVHAGKRRTQPAGAAGA